MISILAKEIVLRYLNTSKKYDFITIITIFTFIVIIIVVEFMILVMSVMNGFRSELLSRIICLNGHISVYHNSTPIKDFDNLAVRLGAVPGVLSVTPQLQGQATALVPGTAAGALVTGLRTYALAARPFREPHIHTV